MGGKTVIKVTVMLDTWHNAFSTTIELYSIKSESYLCKFKKSLKSEEISGFNADWDKTIYWHEECMKQSS